MYFSCRIHEYIFSTLVSDFAFETELSLEAKDMYGKVEWMTKWSTIMSITIPVNLLSGTDEYPVPFWAAWWNQLKNVNLFQLLESLLQVSAVKRDRPWECYRQYLFLLTLITPKTGSAFTRQSLLINYWTARASFCCPLWLFPDLIQP